MFGDVDEPLEAPEPDGLGARARAWWEELLDTTGTGTRAVVAGVAVVGLVLGALWWLSRQAPPPVESTLPLVDAAASASTTTTAAPTDVVVHVAGAVVAPGVHRLPPGSRVVDAVEASGGLAPDAQADAVNLAAVVEDGAQVYVPREGEDPPVPAPTAAGDEAAGPIDLNAADATLLETLPGVGPATAAAIIDHRERHGPFAGVDGLLEVRGIGEAKLADIRDLVRV